MRELPLRDIYLHGDTHSRPGIYQGMVAQFAKSMQNGANLPPIVVFYDGKIYWLADGFHRVAAARLLEWSGIRAEIRTGARRDAVAYSTKANGQPDVLGLRYCMEDRRHAVRLMLSDMEWVEWSDRAVARHCGVTHSFVQKVRFAMGLPATTGIRPNKAQTMEIVVQAPAEPVVSDAPVARSLHLPEMISGEDDATHGFVRWMQYIMNSARELSGVYSLPIEKALALSLSESYREGVLNLRR